MAVEYLPSRTQAEQRPDDDVRTDGVAERLARWALTYLAAFAASLTLAGGAWALGLFG